MYNQKELEKNIDANCGRPYQQCAISVMDTIADPNITFDEKGICNYYYEYLGTARSGLFDGDEGKKKLEEMVLLIKNRAKGKKYDCILGLSGGADSTYLAFIAKEIGLNPLVVHFDYGWNLEAAVHNIEQTVKVLNFDLYTEVMDWPEFKDLLASYIKASVLDLDVPADHLIFAALGKVARKHRIRSIISGFNIKSEAILPKTWNYDRKFDLTNMLSIQAKYGTVKLKKIPTLDIFQQLMNTYYYRLRGFAPLNFVNYDVNEVKQFLAKKIKWSDYGGKHCENIFTRFYQGYILPNKFNIDKRKAHFSTLIFSGQMSKDQAVLELGKPPYSMSQILEDKVYIAKKLGFTLDEFETFITQPNRNHSDFGESRRRDESIYRVINIFKVIKKLLKLNL